MFREIGEFYTCILYLTHRDMIYMYGTSFKKMFAIFIQFGLILNNNDFNK